MDKSPAIHITGIAGVGMSALAEAAQYQGYHVTGSDRYLDQGQQIERLDIIRHRGIRTFPQDGSGIHRKLQAVVISSAIEPDNPDLLAAQKHAVPVIHRATFLQKLIRYRQVIAVTGTSGKTTVTGMIGWMLAKMGADPLVINGDAVPAWKTASCTGSVHNGSGPAVIEADESDRSCLSFYPRQAVITNISADHFDIQESIALFAQFVQQVKDTVFCGKSAYALLDKQGLDVKAQLVQGQVDNPSFYKVPVPGKHNIENAMLAVSVCLSLGYTPAEVHAALASFPGILRRLQVLGNMGGITVIDDYAHNPAKIAASWKAVAEQHPRILGIWRPHGFGPLAAMKDELIQTWKTCARPGDRIFILPVYYAGGTTKQKVSSRDLVKALQKQQLNAEFMADYSILQNVLFAVAAPGDAILIMGARDPELPCFAKKIAHLNADGKFTANPPVAEP